MLSDHGFRRLATLLHTLSGYSQGYQCRLSIGLRFRDGEMIKCVVTRTLCFEQLVHDCT
jgi:hypothetical protein